MIATILSIWQALRGAVATRQSEESNMVTKILSTLFGSTVIFGVSQMGTSWALTAWSLVELRDSGMALSQTGTGVIDYVGTTDPFTMPNPNGILFIIVVTLMILLQIWIPKKD